jgi:methionyl-tRNA formyltransferase
VRLVYFGSGAFGLPTIDALRREYDIDLVVTQPDRPAGRRRTLTPTPIAAYAADHDLPTIRHERINEPEVIDQIRRLEADAFVVIAYGHKLGPALVGETFAINLHGSLLPKYRGAAPINWAMINGETTTGVTVITLAQTMDAGAILDAASTPIDPMESAGELHERLADLGPLVVLRTLERHARGELKPRPQDESKSTRAPKLSKADGTVRFDQPARAVRCRVHGLTPWPGCTIALGERTLKLLRVQEVDPNSPKNAKPGAVLDDRTIACLPGAVKLLSVQPPGGKSMSFEAYCNGHDVEAGEIARAITG